MKFKTSLKKFIAGLTVSLTTITMIVPSISVSAAETLSGTDDDYLWVTKVTDVGDMVFTNHSNNGKVNITKDTVNNTVNLAFTSSADDVTARTETEVRLDTSSVPGKNHYVSFDITMDKHSEFVATMDLSDEDQFRPYSLYLGTESWVDNGNNVTVTRAAAIQHDPDNYYVKNGALVGNNKGWWNADGVGITWTDTKVPINVKLVSAAEYSYNNANKEQKVYVYINGQLLGQVQTGATDKANQFFNFNTLRLIHYATAEGTENIELSNIEMGYIYKDEAYCATNDYDTTKSDAIWFPEGDKVYVKYTLPTTEDVEWDVLPGGFTIDGKEYTPPSGNWAFAMWTGKFGAVASWKLENSGLTGFTGFDASTGLITDNETWTNSNVQSWGAGDGTAEILLTLDRVKGTYTTERVGYPSTKHTLSVSDWATQKSGQKVQFRTGVPTYTDINTTGVTAASDISYNTANFAIAIESGVVLDREFKVEAVEESDGVTRVIPSGVGNTKSDKVQIIIVQKDSDGYLLQPMMFEKTVRNGIYYMGTPGDTIKKNLVNDAVSANVYIWDNMKPLCTPLELSLTNSAE